MDLYREEILDHVRNPRNWGKLQNPSVEVKEVNPLCGDEVVLGIILDRGQEVKDAGFEAKGCAISIASSSMLVEKMIGKTKSELKELNENTVLSWFGSSLTSSRKECALLPFRALRDILEGDEK